MDVAPVRQCSNLAQWPVMNVNKRRERRKACSPNLKRCCLKSAHALCTQANRIDHWHGMSTRHAPAKNAAAVSAVMLTNYDGKDHATCHRNDSVRV